MVSLFDFWQVVAWYESQEAQAKFIHIFLFSGYCAVHRSSIWIIWGFKFWNGFYDLYLVARGRYDMLIHVDSLFKSIYIYSFQTFSESRYCKGSKPHSAWSACLKAIMAGFGPAFNNGKPASSVSSVRVEAWHKMAQEFVGWAPSALYNQNISDLFRTWRVLVCRCVSSYHWSSWAFDARGIIGGDGRVMEILKKRNCAFDLKRLSALIALVQDHLKSGVQQACWGINDTNNEGMCFCLPSIHYIIEWLCVCSVFILLNPPTGSESARTGWLWWGGFLYFASFCWVMLRVFCRCGKFWSISEPTKDSTQRNDAVNSLYVSTPPPKWLANLIVQEPWKG